MTSITAKARGALLAAFVLLAIFFFVRSTSPSSENSSSALSRHYRDGTTSLGSHTLGGGPRIAKVTMLYGDDPNPIYERAVRSHRTHNERWNYPMYVLREQIAGGYWNKPSYLLSLVVQELSKPKSERVEWLMWVDADLVLINPSIPLSIFIPPVHNFPNTHFLANKDHAGLNTGTFFLHVHEWSVKMLAKSIALPMYRPDIDLGVSVDQNAMFHVFNDTSPDPPTKKEVESDDEELDGADDGLSAKAKAKTSKDDEATKAKKKNAMLGVGGSRGEVMYQPRYWYNTYEWHHAYEGQPGNLLVHFPGLDDDRWRHMSDWLDVVENSPAKWDIPLQETFYPNETRRFYKLTEGALDTLQLAEQLLQRKTEEGRDSMGVRALEEAVDALRFGIRFETDRMNKTEALLESTKALLGGDAGGGGIL